MKTKLFLIAVVFLLVPLAGTLAQESSSETEGMPTHLYIGARWLPTFSRFDVNVFDTEAGHAVLAKTHFVMGQGWEGLVGYNFSPNFGVQAEVLYNVLSQDYIDPNMEESFARHNIQLTYLNLPLLLVLNSNSTKNINVNLVGGPQFGLNLGSKYEVSSGNEVDSLGGVFGVKTADVGFAYGAGIDLGLGDQFSIDLGFRGVFGLLDISNKSQSKTTEQFYILDRAHVQTYSGYIGVKLKF